MLPTWTCFQMSQKVRYVVATELNVFNFLGTNTHFCNICVQQQGLHSIPLIAHCKTHQEWRYVLLFQVKQSAAENGFLQLESWSRITNYSSLYICGTYLLGRRSFLMRGRTLCRQLGSTGIGFVVTRFVENRPNRIQESKSCNILILMQDGRD